MNMSVLPRACAPKLNFEQLLVPPRSPDLAFLNIGVWGHSKEMAYEHSMDRTTSSNFRCCKMSKWPCISRHGYTGNRKTSTTVYPSFRWPLRKCIVKRTGHRNCENLFVTCISFLSFWCPQLHTRWQTDQCSYDICHMNFSEKFIDVPTDVSHKIPKEIQMNKNLVLFAHAVKCCQTLKFFDREGRKFWQLAVSADTGVMKHKRRKVFLGETLIPTQNNSNEI